MIQWSLIPSAYTHGVHSRIFIPASRANLVFWNYSSVNFTYVFPMLDLASKALEVIIYWKLLSNTVRAQFQGGSFTKMALGRESNSSSLPFWDLPPEGSPTLNGQNSCLLTVYLSSPTHSYSNLKSGTGLLLLVPFPISAYCPTLNWQWDSPCYLFQSFAGLSKKNWLD